MWMDTPKLFCIRFRPSWHPEASLFAYVYKDRRTFVTRQYAKTATKFQSVAEAQAIIDRFALKYKHRDVTICETNATGTWTRDTEYSHCNYHLTKA